MGQSDTVSVTVAIDTPKTGPQINREIYGQFMNQRRYRKGGTPPGVGMGHKPIPEFLTPGNVIDLGIAKLGQHRQEVVAWSRG